MSRCPAPWSLLSLFLIFVQTSPASAEEAVSPTTAAALEAAGEETTPAAAEETQPETQAPAPQPEETQTPETTASAQETMPAQETAPAATAEPAAPAETTNTPEAQEHEAGTENEEEHGFFDDLSETDHPFTLSRGRFSLGIVGQVQLLAVPWIDDPMASIEAMSIADAEGFRLRRARFGATGDFPYNFAFRILFELGEEGANILDANVSYEPHPLARLTAGALKVPFSGVMMLSSQYQSFLQRPYIVRSVAPDRALGFEVSGRSHFFDYHVGVFNGGGDFYRGDNNAGMLYVGRFILHALGPMPEGEITQPDGFVFEVAGSYYFNQDATGNRHGVTGELAMRWSRLTVRGEFLWSTFDPAGSPATDIDVEYGSTTRLGFFADVGVFIINEHLQLALRFEANRLIERDFEIQDLNDLWAISPALIGYFLQGRIKLMLQYEHRHEWFEDQVRNDYLAVQVQGRI